MDRDEAAALRAEGGRMRSRESHVAPLPWATLADVHASELRAGFEWTPEAEDAFLLLVAKGYSVRQITGQGEGWPTYADWLKKSGTDPNFKQLFENQKSFRAASLVDMAGGRADSSRAATVQSDRLFVDVAFRTAAALDPETYGNKSQVGISGGLILAAGSLADLAAQAALLHTSKAIDATPSAPAAISSPDNLPQTENA